MKKFVLAASAALLIAAPGLALAQDHHEGEGRPGGAPPHAPQAPRSAAPQGGGQFHSGQPQGGQPSGGYHPQTFPGGQGGYRPQGFSNNQPAGGYHPQAAPSGQGGQGGYRPQGFAGGQQGRGGYYGQGGFNGGGGRPGALPFGYGGHQYFRYQAAPYRYPGGYYGWANHSWRRGEWLPAAFITSSYFINDWYDFGLWQPDYGYEWIRVGADAVLISLADGQVVDVVPGVYYY